MMMRKIKRKINYWFQRRIRGWSDDECWDLRYSFIKWFNEHLKVYKRDANKIVDLEYHKYIYKGKQYTQLELINILIESTDKCLLIYGDLDFLNQFSQLKDDIFEISNLIFWDMWW